MKKFILVIISLLVLIAAGLGITRLLRGQEVAAIHPSYGTAVEAVYATGTVEATIMLPIAPRISAKLAELMVDEGGEVEKGQVLAQLEDEDLQSNLRQFYTREAQAKLNFNRKAELLRQRTITRADYDNAKAEWDSARAATSRAKTEANFMKLVAPDDGVIIKRDGEVGQLIPAQQPVFWMRCCAPLRITTEVNEEDIAKVKPDQEVLISADAFPNQVFKGKVQSITPKGDPIARTYRVRVAFIEETPLHIGMTAETNIIISSNEQALLVPSSAVNSERVWLIEDGKLLPKQVKIGVKGIKQTEILEGLTVEDIIAVQPSVTWQEGKAVHAATMVE